MKQNNHLQLYRVNAKYPSLLFFVDQSDDLKSKLVCCRRAAAHMGTCVPEADIKGGTSNHIPQYMWDVITCPCHWYLLLARNPHIYLPGAACFVFRAETRFEWRLPRGQLVCWWERRVSTGILPMSPGILPWWERQMPYVPYYWWFSARMRS